MSQAIDRPHPTPRDYVLIAVILFAITAAEVGVTYVDALDSARAPLLLTMSAVKFFLVVGWYMHLRFDSKAYRYLFMIGLILTPVLFGAVLFTFGLLIGN